MCSLMAVLGLILGGINFLYYREVVSDSDDTLEFLMENGGTFPKQEWENEKVAFSPELPYESRYFSVDLSEDGTVQSSDTGQIAAVDFSMAVRYAKSILKSGKTQGFVGNYRYLVSDDADKVQIVFLDCGRTLSGFWRFLVISVWVAAFGLVAVFILIFLFSKRIIRPMSENYEKQKRFITDAGHEIKTPLTIIDADADVLEMELGENEWLADIRNQTRRMTALTNDLIYLSRMEEAKNGMPMIDFPLSDVTEEVADSFVMMAKAQNKKFTSSIEPYLTLHGDEKSIRQLISVLLDNALRYADPEGVISLELEKKGRNIRLSVYNTTAHISQEDTAHLFERFYRSDKSRNSDTGGYGIGLSIASAVVTAHKGKITAATKDERSLLITAVFPAGGAHREKERENDRRSLLRRRTKALKTGGTPAFGCDRGVSVSGGERRAGQPASDPVLYFQDQVAGKHGGKIKKAGASRQCKDSA